MAFAQPLSTEQPPLTKHQWDRARELLRNGPALSPTPNIDRG